MGPTKLVGLETHLRSARPQWNPSHQEYVSLLQGFSFVVRAQPISTRCTITSNVHTKVVGKPETSSSKAKVGQGDYKSIIFWTNDQSKVMIWDQQFVVFISPWSTGKTICMREKARIWASDNPSEKLFFCVVRVEYATNKSLLEMELNMYFQEHNVRNVKVLGLPCSWNNAMSELQKKILSLPTGSWMVDELCMPVPKDHTKWAAELKKMRNHFARHPGPPKMLWISIAGIDNGKPEHFKHDYLAALMPGFHIPVMELPLRNTREVIKLAGLDLKPTIKSVGLTSMYTNPSYNLPPNLMFGVQCQQIKVKVGEDADYKKAIKAACQEILKRTAAKGFPVLLDSFVSTSRLMAALQRVVGPVLLYTHNGGEENEATEFEVEEWLKKWKRNEEGRVLVIDGEISRGWEADAVVAIGSTQTENLVMRTCGFCFLIKQE